MKTDRNKNNVKSEENMILEKSRRSDANVFPVENKGKGKIAKAKKRQVKGVIWKTVLQQKWLSMGIVFAVAGAVVTALIPPLILAKIVDTVTAGKAVTFWVIFLYFAMLVLTGFMESAREGLLTVFGQKITHALRSSLMEKFICLTSDKLTGLEPGTLASRFVGDVDTVENLFTSGIISMFADACKIISILVVIWFENKGLAVVLLVILPFLFWFTRHVQKNMLAAVRLWEEPLDMCRKPFIISVPSIALAGKNIWKSVTTLTSVKVTRQWREPIFMMQYIHR